jgi:hypothetical protein
MKNQKLIKRIIMSVILRKSVILFSLLSLLNYQLYSSFTPVNYSYSKTDAEIAAANAEAARAQEGAKEEYCEAEELEGNDCDNAWKRMVSGDNNTGEAVNLEDDLAATANRLNKNLESAGGWGGGMAWFLYLTFASTGVWALLCYKIPSLWILFATYLILFIADRAIYSDYKDEQISTESLIVLTNVDQATKDLQEQYFQGMEAELKSAISFMESKISWWKYEPMVGLALAGIMATLEAFLDKLAFATNAVGACPWLKLKNPTPVFVTPLSPLEYYAFQNQKKSSNLDDDVNKINLDFPIDKNSNLNQVWSVEKTTGYLVKLISAASLIFSINSAAASGDDDKDGLETEKDELSEDIFSLSWLLTGVAALGPLSLIITASVKGAKTGSAFSIPRIVVIVLLGLVAGIVVSNMEDILTNLNQRLKAIQDIALSINVKIDSETESPGTDVDTAGSLDSSTSTVASAEEESDVIQTDSCPTGKTDSDGNASIGTCSSENTKQFKSATSKAREVGGAGVNKALDIMDKKIDGLMEEGKIESGDAASNEQLVGALKKLKRGLLNKLNDKLKSEGKKELDIDGEAQKQFDDLKSAMIKATSQMSGKELANLNSLSGFGTGGLFDSKKEEKGKDYDSERLNAKKKPAGPDYSSMLGMDSDLDLDDGIGPNQEELANFDADAESNKYEDSADDIVNNKGVSIFKVLSIRYKKSAYPKFFIKKSKVKN